MAIQEVAMSSGMNPDDLNYSSDSPGEQAAAVRPASGGEESSPDGIAYVAMHCRLSLDRAVHQQAGRLGALDGNNNLPPREYRRITPEPTFGPGHGFPSSSGDNPTGDATTAYTQAKLPPSRDHSTGTAGSDRSGGSKHRSVRRKLYAPPCMRESTPERKEVSRVIKSANRSPGDKGGKPRGRPESHGKPKAKSYSPLYSSRPGSADVQQYDIATPRGHVQRTIARIERSGSAGRGRSPGRRSPRAISSRDISTERACPAIEEITDDQRAAPGLQIVGDQDRVAMEEDPVVFDFSIGNAF